MKKTINGKEITYGDVIHQRITTHFSLKDRFKILFGKPLITDCELYVEHDDAKLICDIVTPHVPVLFPKKRSGGMIEFGSANLSTQ
jgi:tagatose-1,6-bisphosphate aldolase non-catalytic subunit AgaZ/GatZ